jgi:hypothetical protein
MNGTIKQLVAIAALAGAVACGDAASPTQSLVEPGSAAFAQAPSGTLTFSSTQSYETAQPQSASGSVGGIDFAGSVTTGTPCVNVTATHSGRTGSVTVTVNAAPSGGGCIQVITNNNYTGRVSGLAPGSYTFTVIHSVGGSSSTAYSGSVTVQ